MGIFYGFELLFTVIEMGTTAYLCHRLFEKRFAWSGVGLGLVTVLNIGQMYANKWIASLFSTTAVAVAMGIFILGTYVFYKIRWRDCIAVIVLWYNAMYLLDIFLIIGVCLITGNEHFGIDIALYCSWQRIAVFIVSRLVDIVILWIMLCKITVISQIVKYDSGLLAVMSGVGYYSLIRLQLATQFQVNGWFVWQHAGDYAAVFLLIFLYYVWKDNLDLQKEKLELEQKKEMLFTLYGEVKEQNQLSSESIHNMKHHIHALKLLSGQGNIDGINKYLLGMEDDLKILGACVWSGDQMLDALLNWKVKEGQRKQIRINIKSDVFHCTVEERDLCIIVGNLMDNAIEACEKVKEVNREISVTVSIRKNVLTLRILNSVSQRPRERKGKLLSSKRDYQSYGYGIESVRRVVNRYHGQLYIFYDEKQFEVVILMMMPGE